MGTRVQKNRHRRWQRTQRDTRRTGSRRGPGRAGGPCARRTGTGAAGGATGWHRPPRRDPRGPGPPSGRKRKRRRTRKRRKKSTGGQPTGAGGPAATGGRDGAPAGGAPPRRAVESGGRRTAETAGPATSQPVVSGGSCCVHPRECSSVLKGGAAVLFWEHMRLQDCSCSLHFFFPTFCVGSRWNEPRIFHPHRCCATLALFSIPGHHHRHRKSRNSNTRSKKKGQDAPHPTRE